MVVQIQHLVNTQQSLGVKQTQPLIIIQQLVVDFVTSHQMIVQQLLVELKIRQVVIFLLLAAVDIIQLPILQLQLPVVIQMWQIVILL